MRAIGVLLKCVAGLLIVVGSLSMAGCASPGTTPATEQSTPTSSPQPASSTSTWQSIHVPTANLEFLAYTVSPTDPETIYACTSDGSSPTQNPITLWRTRNAGQHWSALHLPTSPGTNCEIAIAPAQPQRIAVLITNPYENARPCDSDVLYLSNDGGNSWQHIPYSSIAPQGAHTVFCQIIATSHYLYLCYSFGGGQSSPQVSLLERSGDNGANWTRIDTAFGSNALFLPPQVGPDDTLALIVRHFPTKAQDKPVIWMTHDAGNSWLQIGTLPPSVGTYLLAPPATNASWPTAATPFYALAAEQIPSNLYRVQAFESGNGRQWAAIPPLPVPGVRTAQPGLLQPLAVTKDGRLLAFGVNPKSGFSGSAINAPKASAFWLWIWNPSTSRWQVLSPPLNHTADESCGLCWYAQVSTASGADASSYLYVYYWNDPASFFRVRLPSV